MTSYETRPDRDALRERVDAADRLHGTYHVVQQRRAKAGIETTTECRGCGQRYTGNDDTERRAHRIAAVLAVVEPALAQRDAEIERLREFCGRVDEDNENLGTALTEARRVIAAVEKILDVVRPRDSATTLANTIRAVLSRGRS